MIRDVNIAPPDERRVRATRTVNAVVPIGLAVLVLGWTALDVGNTWLSRTTARTTIDQLQTQLERTTERASPEDRAIAAQLSDEVDTLVENAPKPVGMHAMLAPIVNALHGADRNPPELWLDRIVIRQPAPATATAEDRDSPHEARLVVEGQATEPRHLQRTLTSIENHTRLKAEPSDTRRDGRLYGFTLDVTYSAAAPDKDDAQ